MSTKKENRTDFEPGDTVAVHTNGLNPASNGPGWDIGTVTKIDEMFGDLVIFGELDDGSEFFLGRDRDGHGQGKIRHVQG